jgi:hypothetical protein
MLRLKMNTILNGSSLCPHFSSFPATEGWHSILSDKFKLIIMAKYSEKAQDKVEKAMHERKHGTLKSGSTGKTVKSRKQAIAIGLSEARREGARAPQKKSAKSTSKA